MRLCAEKHEIMQCNRKNKVVRCEFNFFYLERHIFRAPIHMCNAAKSRERNGQMRPLRTCIHRKTLETQKPVQDYHCTPDIGCLHDVWA